MAIYRLEYGDDENGFVEETIEADEVVREDGWVVFFKDNDAVQRLREEHVRSMTGPDA